MFISTRSGELALRSVISAQVSGDQVEITYDDGVGMSHTRADKHRWENALRDFPVSMMPAIPGTYAIDCGWEGDEFWEVRTNVIGWAIVASGMFLPVTAGGINDGVQNEFSILHPDGRVDVPEVGSFESHEAWRQSEIAKREPRAA